MRIGQMVKVCMSNKYGKSDIYDNFNGHIGKIIDITIPHDVYPFSVQFKDGESCPFEEKELRPLRRTCFEKK